MTRTPAYGTRHGSSTWCSARSTCPHREGSGAPRWRGAHSARQVLRRHPWAIPLLQSGTAPGPATLRQHGAITGTLRLAGFSVRQTAHAEALLDSYLYGFALSENALPINGPETVAEVAEAMMEHHPLDGFPHLAEFSTEHIMRPDYDFGSEFDLGLDVILDGLDRVLQSAAPWRSTTPSTW